jgi:hypothetical protein
MTSERAEVMTVDSAATSSPQSFPEPPGSDARLTRLQDALKQLRAKSTATVPLASIAPIADVAPAVLSDVLPSSRTISIAIDAIQPATPIETTGASHATPDVEAAVAHAALGPQVPPSPPTIEPSPSPVAAMTSSLTEPLCLSRGGDASDKAPSFCLESWFSPASLRQYRQLAGNIASQLPAGDPAAIGIAVLSCRDGAEQLAARLALCLAERREGVVLLVEPAGPRLALARDGRRAGLVDVVAGRADWADAISSTEMEALNLIVFGSTAASEDAPLNDQWRTALVDLKRRFRYIVSAARPGESFPSDAWLAAIDGVYLAVSLGDAPRKLVASHRSRLIALGARLLGCIAIQ